MSDRDTDARAVDAVRSEFRALITKVSRLHDGDAEVAHLHMELEKLYQEMWPPNDPPYS